MRLDCLTLTRYGRFTDRSLSFATPGPGAPDLHIVFGPNEAGKSTLFAAWLDMLFGVPSRSRYDFLHPGPTMQIGAQLTHAGVGLNLRRLKRNTGSLLDRHDAPIPEAVLQGALGGLSREGYSAMFSLDDETLERGGDSILASRGDLGEMLFSASAGLASLAPQLETLRSGFDGFHRSGKRSGWLYDAKKQLAELDKQRRELEVSAGALQKLMREAAAAEQDWRDARAAEDAAQAELDRLQELAGTLPLLAQLSALTQRLEPLQHLPDATPTVQEQGLHIENDRRDLTNRMRDRALRLQALTEQLAALAADPDALAQAAAIEAADALRPEHDTALKDLPRRREEAADANTRVQTLLAQLGQQGARAADLCLTGAQISTLRTLLAARSGLQGRLATAAEESRKAADLLERERARLGDPGPDEDAAALAALLTRLRTQDPVHALTGARRDRDQAAGRVATAIAALAPWAGDGNGLAALAVPAAWQIGAWQQAQDSARQQELDAMRDATALRDAANNLQAEASSRTAAQSATGITLADAARARSSREALWAAHLADLSAASARRFEQAMREDDRIGAVLAEAMAEARRVAQDQTAQQATAARLAQAEARLAAALGDQAKTRAAIDAACAALGLQGETLAGLQTWLNLRNAALTECRALRDAETALTRCEEVLEAATHTLTTALHKPAGTAALFETLLAEAVARVQASDQRREARQRLAMLASDLRKRQQDETDASAAVERWRRDWMNGCRGSILAGYANDDPGLGASLDLLDQLGVADQTAAALNDRIDKMEANRLRFAEARAGILTALALDQSTAWPDVLTRLRRAQDAARDHDTLSGQIAREHQQDLEDRRALADRNADAQALGATLGWTDAQGSLADHIARCCEAASLRQTIDTLRNDLRDRPAPAEGQNMETLRQQIARLKTDQHLLRSDTEARYGTCQEAKRRIEAVGGDDTLARIAATRENLLLDIRERAEAHLAGRFGLIAFEAGLRRYRDQHRSAMLTRASEAFSQLSRGAYSGLAAQPDGAQEVLVALSTTGGAKLAVDLSKGTRFQLYLALRIAGYHELAQSRPTVPFIADDIMETFDDDRSAAAFALLADMARVGQVIYLTHHRHLCDIARAVCPQVNVIEL
ncbi:MAG: AAA family ATPase [Pseudotabrizicola sp.]|uniref:ATP-binding protein n=1 Tax=Pseudotabrizicola sp. TaxID=2939647 RepID=UPI00271EBD92|nr:YhaN family protein [Pseudotabrizicola sp.]MDO9639923.1 AAA family ATPase [Pseudotabrizicola sp.]